jgi:hypothetical protein
MTERKRRGRKLRNGESIGSVRAAVVEYLSEKAVFREMRASEQEPWDGPKNACYAQSLRLVAKYVEKLPHTDGTLRKLARCESLFVDQVFHAPQDRDGRSETDEAAIHCGPRGQVIADADCGEWFKSWAETAITEARNKALAKAEEGDGW